jgi:hypothetical protein
MQLRVSFPARYGSASSEDEDVIVRSETGIRAAGFAAARAVRTWLRNMPFVPSTGDLHFNVYAVVEADEVQTFRAGDAVSVPAPKRKRERKPRGKRGGK